MSLCMVLNRLNSETCTVRRTRELIDINVIIIIIIIIIINRLTACIIMMALSQNYMLQDHLTVSSHTITNSPTLHDSKYATLARTRMSVDRE